jgi:carotenoid cleavage dioxygenase-like enzyme
MPGFQLFASEPKFVARPGAMEEDDGWLLTVIFDSGGWAQKLEWW